VRSGQVAVADDVNTLLKLGNVLFRQGDFEAAIGRFQQALLLEPGNAAAHYNVGLALQRQGKFDEAIASYQQALYRQPDLLVAKNNLGAAFKALGQFAAAAACYRQILQVKPDYAEVHTNLGNALAAAGSIDEAAASYREALRLAPQSAETHFNLGFALSKHGRVREANDSFQDALRIQPDHVEALFNLGVICHEQGKLDEALALYDQALRLHPDHAAAHVSRALLWLALGDWTRGWAEFEWRWRTQDMPGYNFRQPRWGGTSLAGKTILLYAEQGLGDTLNFLRYVPLVKERGGKVILECQPPLLRLLANFPGIDHLIGRGSAYPDFDCYAPLLSLPGIFQTTFNNCPAAVPYIHADGNLVEHWQHELTSRSRLPGGTLATTASDLARQAGPIRALKVGIAWQGNPGRPDDIHRSIPLKQFARLAEIPGVEFFSLQKGAGTEQLAPLANQFPVLDLCDRLDEAAGPFMDTAAVMKNVDLVISADTAVPHLAGALGIPVWLALSLIPDWRWMLEREDSPWYPTMRLFRQSRYGEWDSVFEKMAAELQRLVNKTPDKRG
jgi:tetratricopeptide (TPR) repeat protein